MRAYTIAVAALALDVEVKWLDNVLSHHHVPGIARKKQGIQRQIPPDSLLIIGIAQTLIATLSIPIGRSLDLAAALIADQGTVEISPISIRADVRTIAARLHERLADAVEGAANMRRGRPKTG